MKPVPFPSWLPGFVLGCVVCGVVWQRGRPAGVPASPPQSLSAGKLLFPSPLVVSPGPPALPSLDAGELSQIRSALLGTIARNQPRETLDLFQALTWGDTTALLGNPFPDPRTSREQDTLAHLLVTRLFTFDAPAALGWVMKEGPAATRPAWLEPYFAYWKKQNPTGFQAWLSQNEETLRLVDSDYKIRKEWLADPRPANNRPQPAAKAPVQPLDEVFSELAGHLAKGRWSTGPLQAWSKQTGQWQQAMDRAGTLEDSDQCRSLQLGLSQEWVKTDFAGWVQWADQQTDDRSLELYRSSLWHLGDSLHHSSRLSLTQSSPDLPEATAHLLRPEVLEKIISKTGTSPDSSVIKLVQTWLVLNPAEASHWLSRQAEAPWQDGLKNARAHELMTDDPPTALTLANTIRESHQRAQTMLQIHQFWEQHEPFAARAFVEEHYKGLAAERQILGQPP